MIYDIWPYEFPVLDEPQKDGIDSATKIIPRVTECESGVGYWGYWLQRWTARIKFSTMVWFGCHFSANSCILVITHLYSSWYLVCLLVLRFREVASCGQSFASARVLDTMRLPNISSTRGNPLDFFCLYNTRDWSFSFRVPSLQISRALPSTSGKNPRCLAVSVAQSIVQFELTREKLGSLGGI
jgi:hypothetical protein